MLPIYPIKFNTIFKDKIWGGNKIKTILGKDFTPLPNCGETWEISGVKGNFSIVANGELEGKGLDHLLAEYGVALIGQKNYERFGNEFPLLIKFIDANEDLSIQVHPNDELARLRHNSFGKTEMWYVLQADVGATLIAGFNQDVGEESYLQKLHNNQLGDILNKETVNAGDVFFLPAGRVHTIGKGLLIAEIQQTSDITYRIYDFDRIDDNGNKRELHTQEALAALDYKVYPEYKTIYPKIKDELVAVVDCPYFTTNILDYTQNLKRDYSDIDSFIIHVCVEGAYSITVNDITVTVKKGESILLPALVTEVVIATDNSFKILETFVN